MTDAIGSTGHAVRVVVWDVPPAVECGAAFNVRVGVKCDSGCPANGWSIEVRGHDGEILAAAITDEGTWEQTDGLHAARITLRAPSSAGLHEWEVRVPAPAVEPPHGGGAARLGIRAVPVPDCLLTVVALDQESQAPVPGAKVVAHPYRGTTDERGTARLRIPAGTYRVFVSGQQYFPFRRDCEVAGALTVTAELAVDREFSNEDLWV